MNANKTLVMQALMELTEDVHNMSESSQQVFAAMLPIMSKLYRDDSTSRAVLIIGDDSKHTLVRINADEYEANALLHDALPFHDEMIKADMPELLN